MHQCVYGRGGYDNTILMAIQAKENEIELIITWVCNWTCEYCCVDTHKRPTLTFKEVEEKLQNIPEGYNVTLSGGEPGAMKRHELEFIINELKHKNCTISINTNGTFIRKFRDLCDSLDTILYHCSQDILETDEIIQDDTLNIDYLLIVTDNNFDRLGAFLDKYPNILFNLVAATNPDGINNVTLSNPNKYAMLTKYHTRMTYESIGRVFNEKDFDAITYL